MFIRQHLRLVLTIAAICLTAAFVNESHAKSEPKSGYLADTPVNLAWEAGDKPDELVFNVDSGREPVIELKKDAFKEGEVSLEIYTDVQTFYFRAGTQRFELKLEPDRRYRLALSGQERHETMKLNNKELTYDKPKWVKMVKAEEPDTFTIMFLRAREVKIRIREKGKKVELKLPEKK